jgi:aerobic carbon-monoxide dehydrogenase medium subunit
MYPAAFRYHAPESIAEALRMAAELPDARFLAGGHSLIPVMKQRFAQPPDLIDLQKIAEMREISALDGRVSIGATVTHWEVQSSALLSRLCPLLPETAGHIGDPQVRNCGTLGGSLAYADPGADYPACILALDAILVCESLAGRRSVDASDWFNGLFTTALEPGELLVEIHLPVIRGRTGSSYRKLPHPASRMAVLGVAVELMVDEAGTCDRIDLGTVLRPRDETQLDVYAGRLFVVSRFLFRGRLVIGVGLDPPTQLLCAGGAHPGDKADAGDARQ